MAIANRELDASEQQETFSNGSRLYTIGLSGAAIVYPLYLVPRPMTLVKARFAAIGVSGTPLAVLHVTRSTAAGATIISGGMTTLTLQALGTSGPQTGVIAAAGSSFLTLAKNDLITVDVSGDDSAVFLNVDLVLQSIQDIKSHF